MRRAPIVLATLLLGSGTGPAQAQPIGHPANLERSARAEAGAPVVPIGYTERALVATRGQVAVCANLAALRALDAKAIGASDAAQNRILDVTFVRCMAGPQTAD